MNASATSTAVHAVERLRAATHLVRLAEADQLQAVAELAEHNGWTTDDELDFIGERPVRLGADGSRLVGEFLPLEVAAVLGTSVTSATWLIRDVLNLQSRHPALWASVQNGAVRGYQAFQLVRLAAEFDLSCDEATELDNRLRSRFGRIGWARLMRLARGLVASIAAEKVQQAAASARASRYVRTAASSNPLVTDLYARVDAADAQQLETTIATIAQTLGRLGDTDELGLRRSKALGILATPARAEALLHGTDDDRYVPRTKVYLHLHAETVHSPDGVARSESLGPVTKQQLAELFGTHRITVTPVLRTGEQSAVDSYEIPERMRESVVIRDVCEPFPFSSRAARRLDLDHIEPYLAGAVGQTRPDNLAPLSRRVHRSKTARRWSLVQPSAGRYWWTSPTGQQYRVMPKGTDDLAEWSTAERALALHLDSDPPGR